MKILILSHEYPPVGGGGANACLHLAREYARKGHNVRIVTVWYPGEEERAEERIGDGAVVVHRLRARREHLDHSSFAEMLDYLRKAWRFADMLERELRFDVCQVFFAIPSGPIAWKLKERYGLPYVIRFGGGDIPGFQDRFRFAYKLLGPMEKKVWTEADALVANSTGLKKLARQFYDKKEILVIPNGADVDLSEKKEETVGKQDDRFTVLFVSRLIERKGLQDFLPQMRELSAQAENMGKKMHLIVVGDGPYRKELESMVFSERIESVVDFVGQKSKAELPQYYCSADVFILPSHKEGMPNVVLEAMSYGLPIIMTPCEGSEELVDGNGCVTGVENFSEKIDNLARDHELREQWGKRSRELVEGRFQWKDIAENNLALLGTSIKSSFQC